MSFIINDLLDSENLALRLVAEAEELCHFLTTVTLTNVKLMSKLSICLYCFFCHLSFRFRATTVGQRKKLPLVHLNSCMRTRVDEPIIKQIFSVSRNLRNKKRDSLALVSLHWKNLCFFSCVRLVACGLGRERPQFSLQGPSGW